jgi:hypothetical protein
MIICFFGFHTVLTIDIELIEKEKNLFYSHLQTQSDLNLFYEKLLSSNGIDDIKTIQRAINQDDIRQLNLEHKVNKKES